MAIFYALSTDGIKVGVRSILPKEKNNVGKTIHYDDPNSPIMSSGGCTFYDTLNNRFINAGTGAWESA